MAGSVLRSPAQPYKLVKIPKIATQSAKAASARAAAETSAASAALSAAAACRISRQLTSEVYLRRSFMNKPSLPPLEKNINRFIFTVSAPGNAQKLQGNGFVFAHDNNGQTELWGATAADVVRPLGKNVSVTFHLNGETRTFPATVELTGNPLGINAALIKLPPQAAEVALPFERDLSSVKKGKSVFIYGLSSGTVKKMEHKVLRPGMDRLVTDFPKLAAFTPELSGSVVLNEKGQAVGIETKGYNAANMSWNEQVKTLSPSLKLQDINEIIPIRFLNMLLKEYYAPQTARRVILFSGIWIGKLEIDEFIAQIQVSYENGTFQTFDRSPLWDTVGLGPYIPDVSQARLVRFIISKDTVPARAYTLDVSTKTVTAENL